MTQPSLVASRVNGVAQSGRGLPLLPHKRPPSHSGHFQCHVPFRVPGSGTVGDGTGPSLGHSSVLKSN